MYYRCVAAPRLDCSNNAEFCGVLLLFEPFILGWELWELWESWGERFMGHPQIFNTGFQQFAPWSIDNVAALLLNYFRSYYTTQTLVCQ